MILKKQKKKFVINIKFIFFYKSIIFTIKQLQLNQTKTITGGVIIKDTKIGNGPEAKKGKTVQVYYIGKLQNGKQFDACIKGKPFKFRLGGGQVIKGWVIFESIFKIFYFR